MVLEKKVIETQVFKTVVGRLNFAVVWSESATKILNAMSQIEQFFLKKELLTTQIKFNQI